MASFPPFPRKKSRNAPSKVKERGKSGGKTDRAREEIAKLRLHMAETSALLENLQKLPPGEPLSFNSHYRVAQLQGRMALLKSRGSRFHRLSDLQELAKITLGFDRLILALGTGENSEDVANRKWNEVCAWAGKVEGALGKPNELKLSMPGFMAGSKLLPFKEIQAKLAEIPRHRAELSDRLLELRAALPEGVAPEGILDKDLQDYVKISQRTSVGSLPRIASLVASVTMANPANPPFDPLNRYETGLQNLVQRHHTHRQTLVEADRSLAEGNHITAQALIAPLGPRFPDLNYHVAGRLERIAADIAALRKLSGAEREARLEKILAEHPGLPPESELAGMARQARDWGEKEKAIRRRGVMLIPIVATLGLCLLAAGAYGISRAVKSAEEEADKKRARLVEQNRVREAEEQARAEQSRLDMLAETRLRAEQEKAAQARMSEQREFEAAIERFTDLNKSAPLVISGGSPESDITLLWIPPGSYIMGAPEGTFEDKSHTVSLTKGLWMGRTEVTQAQWQSLMGNNPSSFKGPNMPVEQVDWNDANRFARKLTERELSAGHLPQGLIFSLPTEAQWEYACRAGSKKDHPEDIDEIAWNLENSGRQTKPAGTKKPNAWGLQDMFGNVSEWCLDWYQPYSSGNETDPRGPKTGHRRVNRGGSWFGSGDSYLHSKREKDIPELRSGFTGFRIALVMVPQKIESTPPPAR